MGDESASLDGKGKLLRRPFVPAAKDLFLRQAEKGDIQFNGVKISGVEFEPLPLGKIGGIEETIPPMGVVVAACTDQDHISNFKLQNWKDSGLKP